MPCLVREVLSTRILTRHCSHYVSPSQTPQVMGEVRRFLEGLIVRGLVVRGFILGSERFSCEKPDCE